MPKKKVFFITSRFPYYPGEQFIESEIKYLGTDNDMLISIFPLTANSKPRWVPEGVEIDLHLTRSRMAARKIRSILKLPFNRFFWSELLHLAKEGRSKGVNFLRLVKQGLEIISLRDLLCEKVSRESEKVVIYCYWNGVASYSSALLKGNINSSVSVVSRAHGGDLYEERGKYHYLPFKRQFVNSFDIIAPISVDGSSYLQKNFGVDHSKIEVIPLGVEVPRHKCQPSEVGALNVLSVSFLIEVKRVDKIIQSLKLLASQGKVSYIVWRHIGGGPLLNDLEVYAKKELSQCGVDWKFLGEMENEDVKKYYTNNSVDVFVNASESEGVPVSIMEAMSFGVPAVAPDVGGVGEIVSDKHGKLMSRSPDELEISEALNDIYDRCKDDTFRDAARQKVKIFYNEKKNYNKLLDALRDV